MARHQYGIEADARIHHGGAVLINGAGLKSVCIDNDSGDALTDKVRRGAALHVRTYQSPTAPCMGMYVDETGYDKATLGIDHAGGLGVGEIADCSDLAATDPDIGLDRSGASAVEDIAAENEHVVGVLAVVGLTVGRSVNRFVRAAQRRKNGNGQKDEKKTFAQQCDFLAHCRSSENNEFTQFEISRRQRRWRNY
ncbi:MAG: hypothetical protein MJE77_26945 [Proteobacteria bacterium]|nr:hypothetical protein [Pseudomonadota bacterium]